MTSNRNYVAEIEGVCLVHTVARVTMLEKSIYRLVLFRRTIIRLWELLACATRLLSTPCVDTGHSINWGEMKEKGTLDSIHTMPGNDALEQGCHSKAKLGLLLALSRTTRADLCRLSTLTQFWSTSQSRYAGDRDVDMGVWRPGPLWTDLGMNESMAAGISETSEAHLGCANEIFPGKRSSAVSSPSQGCNLKNFENSRLLTCGSSALMRQRKSETKRRRVAYQVTAMWGKLLGVAAMTLWNRVWGSESCTHKIYTCILTWFERTKDSDQPDLTECRIVIFNGM